MAKPCPQTYQKRRKSCEKILAALQQELCREIEEHQAAQAREQVSMHASYLPITCCLESSTPQPGIMRGGELYRVWQLLSFVTYSFRVKPCRVKCCTLVHPVCIAQVLLDWIRIQELVLLQLSSTPKADAAADDAMQPKIQGCISLPSSQAACYGSYVGGLVASAGPGKLHQVLQMTSADWSNIFVSSWSQLVQLLELAAHEEETSTEPLLLQPVTPTALQQQQQDQQQQCVANSTHELMLHCCVQYMESSQAPAAAMNPKHDDPPSSGFSSTVGGEALLVAAAASGSSSSSSNIREKCLHDAQQPAAAAPIEAGSTATATIHLSSGAAQHLQQLTSIIDDLVLLTTLALIHHPLPLCYAAGTNCTTRQPAAAPQSHWLRVAQRLELTDTQLLHFATAAKEQQRLRGRSLQEARQLADRLADLSLLVQVAQQIEQRSDEMLQPAGSTLLQAADAVGSAEAPEQQQEAAAQAPQYSQGKSASSELQISEQQLLDRNLRARTMYSQLFSTFIFNTLTQVQIAKLWVASMPFIPIPSAVMAAAAELFQEQQQQQGLGLFTEGRTQKQQQQQPLCVGASSSSVLSAVHQQCTQQRMTYLRQQQQLWVQALQQ